MADALDDLTEAMAAFDSAVVHRDAALADSVLHHGFELVLVHPAPARMPRSRWLDVLPDYVVDSFEVLQTQVDVDEDVAAVLRRVLMTATVLGQDRSGLFVISDVWRRTDYGWRVWRRHSSPLEAGVIPGAD